MSAETTRNRRPVRFTMLEAKEPNNLTDARRRLPTAPVFAPAADDPDFATMRDLVARLGASRVFELFEYVATGRVPAAG